jgi:hypothetical protein
MGGMEPVTVELLGVARLLARRETLLVPLLEPASVARFLDLCAAQAPALLGSVFSPDGALLGGYVLARADGDFLLPDRDLIHPGDRLLLFSTSAGG